MARESKSKRREKRRRREKNKRQREDLLRPSQEAPRVRTTFAAKARRGDEAGLDLTFSGVPVPFDPRASDPSEGVLERHEAVQAWDKAGNPTKGNA